MKKNTRARKLTLASLKKHDKFLIAFAGPVGSGKTHVAKILAKKLKAVHIRTDDIRVKLRQLGKSFSPATRIAEGLTADALRQGRSAISDFDAVRPQRQKDLRRLASKYGAAFVLIRVETPEKLILSRLRRHRYTKNDFFGDPRHAIRVYFIRKRFHAKLERTGGQMKPDFIFINNARSLEPQVAKIVRELKG